MSSVSSIIAVVRARHLLIVFVRHYARLEQIGFDDQVPTAKRFDHHGTRYWCLHRSHPDLHVVLVIGIEVQDGIFTTSMVSFC